MNGMSAKTCYLRQSPRKVRLVASLIRGMGVGPALAQLAHITKAARRPIEKTLLSAIANAENNFQKKRDHLFIKEICVDEGPDIRRWRPRAFGRAAPILKHSCHIMIQLGEREGAGGVFVERIAHDVSSHHNKEKEAIPPPPFDAQISPEQKESHSDIVDMHRTGRHETAQLANVKEKKKSRGFIKNIIQRKTG